MKRTRQFYLLRVNDMKKLATLFTLYLNIIALYFNIIHGQRVYIFNLNVLFLETFNFFKYYQNAELRFRYEPIIKMIPFYENRGK